MKTKYLLVFDDIIQTTFIVQRLDMESINDLYERLVCHVSQSIGRGQLPKVNGKNRRDETLLQTWPVSPGIMNNKASRQQLSQYTDPCTNSPCTHEINNKHEWKNHTSHVHPLCPHIPIQPRINPTHTNRQHLIRIHIRDPCRRRHSNHVPLEPMMMPTHFLLQPLQMPRRMPAIPYLHELDSELMRGEATVHDLAYVLFDRPVQDVFIGGFAVGDDDQV